MIGERQVDALTSVAAEALAELAARRPVEAARLARRGRRNLGHGYTTRALLARLKALWDVAGVVADGGTLRVGGLEVVDGNGEMRAFLGTEGVDGVSLEMQDRDGNLMAYLTASDDGGCHLVMQSPAPASDGLVDLSTVLPGRSWRQGGMLKLAHGGAETELVACEGGASVVVRQESRGADAGPHLGLVSTPNFASLNMATDGGTGEGAHIGIEVQVESPWEPEDDHRAFASVSVDGPLTAVPWGKPAEAVTAEA